MGTTDLTPDDAVRLYITAWSTKDDDARRELLDACWADDGIYVDPFNEIHGREALSRHIGRFLEGGAYGVGPGCRIPISSGVDHHHGMVRFTWVLVDPEGTPLSRGSDIGELAPDGRLRRITGFFGPPPPVPADWPDRLVWTESA